jgi:hypothetical protein
VSGEFSLQSDNLLTELNWTYLIVSLLPYGESIGEGGGWVVWASGYAPLFLVHWVLFRVLFSSGIAKLYVSTRWKEGTAMDVYYWTQPLPTRIAYYAHTYLPRSFHRLCSYSAPFFEMFIPLIGLIPLWACQEIAFWSIASILV